MFQTVTIEFLSKYADLLRVASEGKDTFGNELCNSMIKEFDLQAAVLFRVLESNSLSVIGRSDSANASYLMNAKFNCNVCENLKKNASFSVHSDSKCELAISEFLIYESCVLLSTPNGERLLLKIAKKSAFNQSDSDALKKISPFYSQLIHIWLQARNGFSPLTDTSFSKLVDHSTVSLRNSANSILGITSILNEENLTATQLDYITNIKRNSQSILISVNDLKALALIESGETKLKSSKIALKDLFNETINIFKSRRGNLPTSINLMLDDKLPREVTIDELKIKYIISSFLRIATHLTGGRQIELVVEIGSPGYLEIHFKMPTKTLSQETISHFFNPFKISTNPELKGSFVSGLETNLLKKYAQLLGGDINLESSLSKGTIIKLRFPIVEGAGKLSKPFSNIPKPSDGHNAVLVIEDDYATSKLMSNYLKKWGYEPTVVNTEEQVMSLIDKVDYLAVILDIEIPNVNGLELLRKINTHPRTKRTPVIVCSVEAEEQKAYMMGAVEYFVKPINYNYLVEVLTSYKLRKDSNVLCVDDDLPTLNLVKQAIETAGFNAIAEHISANVMDLIKDKDIDLAIIDLDMPHPNGFELIKLIKSEDKFKNLPIIIYTGKENYAEDLKQIDGLFDDLLSKKSTNIEDLAETINSMIKRYEEPPPVKDVVDQKDEPKILLAEDYKHSQIIVTRLLKKNNFQNIVIVENGQEALNIANKENFDLILMDMQMPVMNGFEATKKIRELPNYKNTPIIALTAFAMRGDREKCLAAGATDYIPKPIDSKEFIEKIKYYLNSGK